MKVLTILTIAAGCAVLVAGPAFGQSRFSTLYTFEDADPTGLTVGNGVFYGGGPAPSGGECGAIFQLSPPAAPGGEWSETILYAFADTGDACSPGSSLVMGPDGALYGLTVVGGMYGSGAMYRLQPPSSLGGAWTESVVYSTGPAFTSGLVKGPGGSFYVLDDGGTYGWGALVQLSPPAVLGGAWTGTEVYSFGAGQGAQFADSLLPGPNGSLYGTSAFGGDTRSGYGTVFQLIPPAAAGDAWTEILLHSFVGLHGGAGNPNSLVQASDGTLFGTAYGFSYNEGNGAGAVFQLTPPASQGGEWAYTILKNFDALHPDSPIILHNGVLYSALETTTGGAVFALQPPATAGAAWTLVFLHNYTDGQVPFGPMVIDQNGTLYGATGTIYAPFSGTVYQIETR